MSYGTINADVMQSSVAGVSLGAGNASIMKNRIINGSMTIDQRNAGASVTPNGIYTLDRWLAGNTQTGKFSVQQNAGSVTPPVGFTNYLGVTSLSAYSVASGDTFLMAQSIEGYNIADLGWGSANAKTITLSFQVYSSLTGTFGGSLRNQAANRSYAFSYSIPVANTWTTISVTIAGDTTGTWVTNNGAGIVLAFGLGSGSTFSTSAGSWQAGNFIQPTGSVSVVGTNGATFYITGVQLELGTSATGFEYRQYGQELALCQRYFCKFGGTATYEHIGTWGSAASATNMQNVVTFPVSMRSSPSLTAPGNLVVGDGVNANIAVTAVAIASGGSEGGLLSAGLSWSVAGGLTTYRPYTTYTSNTTSAYVGFSAEL